MTHFKQFGWDKNLAIYRYLQRGEKTRGLLIQNPKKVSKDRLIELTKGLNF